MISTDYLIVGGGIAGTTAAETLRQEDPFTRIAIVEQEPNTLYSRVLIPAYLKHKVSREKLFLRHLADYEARRIDFYPSASMVRLDASRHEVSVRIGKGDVSEMFSYKKLLVSTGGLPTPLQDTSVFHTPVFRMQTLEDADGLQRAMEETMRKEALVVGDGFIAMEFFESLFLNGYVVHALCRSCFFGERRFGKIGGQLLEENFKRRGIRVHKSYERLTEDKEIIHLGNGESVRVGLIGVGIGLARNFNDIRNLETNVGVLTNEFLQTSDSHIFAAGDIAEFYDVVAKRHRVVGNWTNAFLQGRTAALNMIGHAIPFSAVTSYNIINFGSSITLVGDLEDSDETWEKVDAPQYMRVFLKEGIVKGAALINGFQKSRIIASLVQKQATRHELESTI